MLANRLAAAEPTPADRMLADYFRVETAKVNAASLAEIKTLQDWTERRARYREELLEMLGLSPFPEKTDLHATVTGRVEHEQFFVEKLHYQSRPGLYATANLYVPKNLNGRKVPAILYVCGHGAPPRQDGMAFGAKAQYQHHGAWFALHGYVCLTIDTIQLGELEGLHHGTHREGMWWWNARGYTPEGVEVWNSIRALDYLQSRPEVDGDKLGMTGRSGGGAYTWYTAAVDERVKVAVPVAGITDLHNHVIDGTVAGHCDCMFMVNTYRWDYGKLAAMLAPRPLLIANSDKDRIFPLEGVLRVHRDTARIYDLHQATDKLGLLITEGPHKDTQDLQVPAFRWFNRWLKNDETTLITVAAEKFFTPAQLRVFPKDRLPADQRTTKIHETFVPMAAPAIPANPPAWAEQRDAWMAALREKVFRGWPARAAAPRLTRLGEEDRGDQRIIRWELQTQDGVHLPAVANLHRGVNLATRVIVVAADEATWGNLASDASSRLARESPGTAIVYLAPRGIGSTDPRVSPKDHIQHRRRYMLLGQTLDGMRVWDIRRAVEALRTDPFFAGKPLHLVGVREQAVNALYASLFIENLAGLELTAPPATHMKGPDYLNVLRFLDVPQAAAMAAERVPLKIVGGNPDDWSWTRSAGRQLGWPADRLQW